MQLQDMSYLINEPTCFQSHDPTCTDSILTNRKIIFNTSKTFENDFSDHHKLVSIIIKSGSFRGPPKYKLYKSYKNFDLENFNIALKAKLDSIKAPAYNQFGEAFCNVLNIHAFLKVKMLMRNNRAFVTKVLTKTIKIKEFVQ